jgi:hypothetical protein
MSEAKATYVTSKKQAKRRDYLNELGSFKGKEVRYMDDEDRLILVCAWLDACDDPDSWLIEAYTEQDLQKVDRLVLLEGRDFDAVSYSDERASALLDYFDSTIQNHLDTQLPSNWR